MQKWIQYTLPVSKNAMDLLVAVNTIGALRVKERKTSIDDELEGLRSFFGISFSEWWKRNHDLVNDGVFKTNDYFAAQKRMKRLTAQRDRPLPQRVRYECATKFEESFSLANGSEQMNRLQVQHNLRRHLYGLVGVVYQSFGGFARDKGIDERFSASGKSYQGLSVEVHRQVGLFIPKEIHERVQCCIDQEIVNGRFLFEGEISRDSLPTLKYILERTKELREKHGSGWYPRFTITEITNVTGLSRASVSRASRDLIGITTEAIYDKGKGRYQHKFFLPACRYGLAEELVGAFDLFPKTEI